MRTYGRLRPGFARGLASEAGVTVGHFGRVFRRVMGVTLGGYAGGVLNGRLGVDGQDTQAQEDLSRSTSTSASVSVGAESSWNDFDVLFAAEEEYVSGQDIQTTDDWVTMDTRRGGDSEGQALPLAWASGHRQETGITSGRDEAIGIAPSAILLHR